MYIFNKVYTYAVLTRSALFFHLFFIFFVHATSITLPYSFTAGSPISASQMMGNFASITNALSGTVSSPWAASSSNIYFNTGSVGIGSSAPMRTLDVNGSVNVPASTSNYINNIQIPQVMYQGAGGVTTSGGNYIKYTTMMLDTTNSYNTSTGLFTAPIAGLYWITGSAYVATTSSGTSGLCIYKNGVRLYQQSVVLSSSSAEFSITGGVNLLVGDYVGIYVPASFATLAVDSAHSLSIFLVH